MVECYGASGSVRATTVVHVVLVGLHSTHDTGTGSAVPSTCRSFVCEGLSLQWCLLRAASWRALSWRPARPRFTVLRTEQHTTFSNSRCADVAVTTSLFAPQAAAVRSMLAPCGLRYHTSETERPPEMTTSKSALSQETVPPSLVHLPPRALSATPWPLASDARSRGSRPSGLCPAHC